MGYCKSFLNDGEYMADDVNQLLTRLMEPGVLFNMENADTSLTSDDLNAYNWDSCKITNEGTEYNMMPGRAILPDGTLVAVDSLEPIPDLESGTEQCISLIFDKFMNRAKLLTDSSFSNAGIPIARVLADGTIEDSRVFSSTKIARHVSNFYKVVTTGNLMFNNTGQNLVRETVDVAFSGFSYVSVLYYSHNNTKTIGYRKLQKLNNGEKSDFFTIGKDNIEMACKKNGNYVDIYCRSVGGSGGSHYALELLFI